LPSELSVFKAKRKYCDEADPEMLAVTPANIIRFSNFGRNYAKQRVAEKLGTVAFTWPSRQLLSAR